MVNSELIHLLDNRAFPGGSNVLAWGELVCDADASARLSPETVRIAFRKLQARHAYLGCCVNWDRARKRATLLKPREPVDLAFLAWSDAEAGDAARAMLNTLLQLQFDDHCAQMGVGVHKSGDTTKAHTISVVLGHAIGDLISTTVLLTELVDIMGAVLQHAPLEHVAACQPNPVFPPSAKQLIPASRRGACRCLCCGGLGVAKGMMGASATINRALQFDVIPVPERQGFVPPADARLTAADTAELVALCKKHGVSVHCALAVALHHVHWQYLTHSETRRAAVARAAPRGSIDVALCTTVDLRRRATPPLSATVVGALAYSVVTKIPMSLHATAPEDMRRTFWPCTRALYAQLQAKLDAGEHWWLGSVADTLLPTGPLVSMYSPAAMDRVSPLPLCVGNVGAVQPLTRPGFELRTLSVEFNNSTSGMYVCAVTYGGQLALSCHSRCVTHATLAEIMQRMKDKIQFVLGYADV